MNLASKILKTLLIESQNGSLEKLVTGKEQNFTKKLGESTTNEQEIYLTALEREYNNTIEIYK